MTNVIEDKGLKSGSLGLLAVIAIGVSVIAPAYAMTSSLGPAALEAGRQVPAVLLIGFVPMFLVAMGYKELNDEMPDSGTTFTWASRAFGSYVGWMGGWGFLAANIIVLSNLAGVAVDFFYAFLTQATGRSSLSDLASTTGVNILTCLVFMALATWLCLRGVETTKWVQYILLGFQLIVLVIYAVMAITKAADHGFPAGKVNLSWFTPFQISDFSAFAAALSLSIFLFWGWDLCLTLSEETKGAGAPLASVPRSPRCSSSSCTCCSPWPRSCSPGWGSRATAWPTPTTRRTSSSGYPNPSWAPWPFCSPSRC